MTNEVHHISPEVAAALEDPSVRAVFERELAVNRLLLAIADAMESAGVSQVELARRMNKKPQAISRALQGQQNLTVGTILELAVHLGKTVRFQLLPLAALRAVTEPVVFTQAATESTVQSHDYPMNTVRNSPGSFKDLLARDERWRVTPTVERGYATDSELCH